MTCLQLKWNHLRAITQVCCQQFVSLSWVCESVVWFQTSLRGFYKEGGQGPSRSGNAIRLEARKTILKSHCVPALLSSTQRGTARTRDIKFISHLFMAFVVSFTGHCLATELDWQALWNQTYTLTFFVSIDKRGAGCTKEQTCSLSGPVFLWRFSSEPSLELLLAWSELGRMGPEGC